MTNIDIDAISRTGLPEKVEEVYKYLARYMKSPSRADWLKNRKRNWEAVAENKMWTDKELDALKEADQDDIVVNKCNKGVQASTAIATNSKPEIKVNPRKGGSLYVSELLKRGVDLVSDQNGFLDIQYDAVEECKISGLGSIDVWFNRNKGLFGKIIIETENPEHIYFDPDSRKMDYSDTHLIKAILRTPEYIKDKYGDKVTDEDMRFGGNLQGAEGGKSSGSTGKDNYAEPGNDSPGSDKSSDPPAKDVWEIEAMLLKTVDEYIATITIIPVEGMGSVEPIVKRYRKGKNTREQVQQGIYQELLQQYPGLEEIPEGSLKIELDDTKREIRVHRIIVGKKLIPQKDENGKEVDEIENPYGEDQDGDPILKLNLLKHSNTKDAYPTCPTNFALPINREKNKRRSQHIYQTSILNHPVIVERGGVKWEGKPGGINSRVKLDQGASVDYLQGVVNTQDYLVHDQQCDQDIDDQYDAPDVIRGRNPENAKDQSGRAIAYLQDYGGIMSAPFIRKFEAFIVRTGRAIIAAQLKYWKRHQWEALIDETDWKQWLPDEQRVQLEQQSQGQTNLTEIEGYVKAQWERALDMVCPLEGKPSIDIMDLEVKVTAGSSMPTSRMGKEAKALEEFKLGLLSPEDYHEATDNVNKDKIVARLKQFNQEKAKAESGSPEKVNVTINFKDMPPEAQAQLAQQIGIQMNPASAIVPEQGGQG